MTQVSKANPTSTKPPRRDWPLLVFVFRLLLLGVGGGFAWLLGIVAAYFYPAPNPEMPLVEKVWQQSNGVVDRVRRLPSPRTPSSALQEPVVSSPSPAVVSPIPQLSAEQRQQVQAELTELQAGLQAIRDRTTALESQLGSDRSNEAIETRLSLLAEQLSGAQTGSQATPTNPSAAALNAPAEGEPVETLSPDQVTTSPDTLTITLPSDLLFQRNQTVLRPETRTLLDNVAADLRNYPRAAIQVAGHTDNQPLPNAAQDLSFQQAQAVEQYLASSLGNQYHWVVVGYGATAPLGQTTSERDRQRNRRIEIAIDPR